MDIHDDTFSSLPKDDDGQPVTESLLPVKYEGLGKKPSASGPLTPDFARVKILEAAGVTLAELGAMARRVITKTNDLMDARKVRYFADKGIVMDEREVEDNQTQLGASKQAGEFLGIFSSRAGGSGPNKLEVIINLPTWAEIKTK